MRAAQLSVTVTIAAARANARFSILVSRVPPASKYGLPAQRSRISATSGTAPPFTAGRAANSADGGGHVAQTTSGRKRSVARRTVARPVKDHSAFGGNASGWIPRRRNTGRETAPAVLMILARVAASRAARGSVLTGFAVTLGRALTSSTSHPCRGRASRRYCQRTLAPPP